MNGLTIQSPSIQKYIFSKKIDGGWVGGYPVKELFHEGEIEGAAKFDDLVVPAGIYVASLKKGMFLGGGDNHAIHKMDGGYLLNQDFDKVYSSVASTMKTAGGRKTKKNKSAI